MRTRFRHMVCLSLACAVVAASAWFVRAFREAREVAVDAQCRANLGEIGIMLRMYHEKHGRFPPATIRGIEGKPLQGWRLACLVEAFEDRAIDGRPFDLSKAWDEPPNSRLNDVGRSSFVYWCPDGSGTWTNETSYVAIVGPETVWRPGGSLSLSEIGDGPENTILAVEVATSGIDWIEPRDDSLEQFLQSLVRVHHRDHFHALFADGKVRSVSPRLPPDRIRALVTPNGGEAVELPALAQ